MQKCRDCSQYTLCAACQAILLERERIRKALLEAHKEGSAEAEEWHSVHEHGLED